MSDIFDQITSRPARDRANGKMSNVRVRAHRDLSADISKLVGGNVRQTRKRLGYSLDVLAHASGVSRAMLGQIETAKSVPTVTVLWRVAEALGVTVSDLIARPAQEEIIVVHADQSAGVCPWLAGLPHRVISSPEPGSRQTIIELRLDSGRTARLEHQPRPGDVTLIVTRGAVQIELDHAPPQLLSVDDAAIVSWRTASTLTNTGKSEAVLYLVLPPQRAAL